MATGRRKAPRGGRDWDALIGDVVGALFVALVLTLLIVAIVHDNTQPAGRDRHNGQRVK